MGKRTVSDAHNGHHGGPTTKKTKYNGHLHEQQDTAGEVAEIDKESPKPEFQLSRELVNGTILTDLMQKKWRIGNPIGKGSFGEIFLASDNISQPVTSENAKYVVKIEPHSNGPLFVEIHCLLNTAKATDDNPLPPGMPAYIASGSHFFKNTRYRFLVLQRFDRDLHSIIKNRKVEQKSILILAVQILEVLEHLHDKGYCHSDIKAENLMISKCTYHENQLKQLNCDNNAIVNDNVQLSEESRYIKQFDGDDEGDDEEDNLNDDDYEPDEFRTPSNRKRIRVQYGGSNPVRSCRMANNIKTNSTSSATATVAPITTTTYQEMVTTHYLRPTKKINYSQFFGDETSKSSGDDDSTLDEYITRHRHRLNKKHPGSSKTSVKHYYRHHQQESPPQPQNNHHNHQKSDFITEDRIFLIDFGLASKFMDTNGQHRPFCMDQRRAHDGTLEFTSRDAHLGAHSRRSDLECLGYNLIYWSQGYLPWKEYAQQQQHEKVHWMKEYLMLNVKEMLKHIYGKKVPKYLGEYMSYVNQLSYHQRPNYKKCKRIFQTEYERLTQTKLTSTNAMKLNVQELIKNSINIKEEYENNNLFEMKNNLKMIIKNLGGVLTPFHDNNFIYHHFYYNHLNLNSSNHQIGCHAGGGGGGASGNQRLSPKNLRSKSLDKFSLTSTSKKQSSIAATAAAGTTSKKRKKFSWSEILSKDPDQIARERAEKEFEREESFVDDTPIRYQGKPTYAILEIQNRIKFKDRLNDLNSTAVSDLNDTDFMQLKGFTKPMIDILLKKRKSSMNMTGGEVNSAATTPAVIEENHNNNHHRNGKHNQKQSAAASVSTAKLTRPRTKAGLRTVITPTKRGLDYNHALIQRRTKRGVGGGAPGEHKNFTSNPMMTTDEEESSCSSMNSAAASNSSSNMMNRISSKKLSSDATSTASSLEGDASSNAAAAIEFSEDDDDENSRYDFPTVAVSTNRGGNGAMQICSSYTKRRNHRRTNTTTSRKKTANSIQQTCNGGTATTNNAGKTGGRKRKRNTSKKRKTKVKRKIPVSDENEDDIRINYDNNVDNEDADEDDDFSSSDYEYYPVEKRNGGGDIPVTATFRKRVKRTRSG